MSFKATDEQKKIFHFIKNRNENLVIDAKAGVGKCLGVDTPVLMFDGTIKKVQDVKTGDLLMGDDSTARIVLNTNVGYGKLYKITPTKGDSWICNDVHVMTLYHEQKKQLIDIPLNEINYAKYENGNYRKLRLQRCGVEFQNQKPINVDPYLLGLWLGDGTKENGSPNITVHESETNIIEYLENVKHENIEPKINDYKNNGVLMVSLTTQNFNGRKIKNVLREEFKKCISSDGIFINRDYLLSSYENRIKLLSGLIDSDGYCNNNCYEISTKYESLKNDILFLCRSLGFSAYAKERIKTIKEIGFKSNYWVISISGSFENLNTKCERKRGKKRKQIKSVLRTGFKSEYIGDGEYYGFTLNENGRFLLGDFTITHNTTTIVEGTKLIPENKKTIFLAFNKHIQEELKSRLPEHVHCYTFHGLGVSAIKRKYGDSIKFDEFKLDQLVRKKAKNWSLDKQYVNPYDKDVYLEGIKKLANLCRLTMTLDKKYIPYLADKFDIKIDEDLDTKRVWSVMEDLMNDRKTFDFTDMVFLPAIDKNIWMFQYDYVIVDEIQDLNRAQQKIIEKIMMRDKITKKTTGRFIGVGDPDQAIYGFTGVSDKSFDWFVKMQNVQILPLTYTFRCAQKIVEHAQKIVPNIKHLEGAPEGIVREGSVLDEPEDGDFVLCRITSPLVKLFFHYLLQGKKAVIMGSDIGLSLIEMIDGHKTVAQMMAHLANKLKDYEIALRKRGIMKVEEDSGYSALQDKIEVIRFLTKLSKDLEDMKSKIKIIFSDDQSGIVLSTIHKAKGLEADRVFIARPDKMPLAVAKAWQYKQEKNLEYVAITRAKRELVFDREWKDDEDE